MGIVFRQSVKTSIVNFTGAILGAIIIFISAKCIPKQQLGFIRNVANQAVTLSALLQLGSGYVLIVYIHKYAESARKKKLLLGLSLGVPIIVTGIASIVYFICRAWVLRHTQAEDVTLVNQYYGWLPVCTLLFALTTVLENYLGTQMKVAPAAFMREVVVRILYFVFVLLFTWQFINYTSLVAGTILIYIVPVVAMVFIGRKVKDFGVSLRMRDFSNAEYKEMIHFSWYHFLLSISLTLMAFLDALALPFYDHSGLSSVAIYVVAVFIMSFLQVPFKAMQSATYAVLAQALTNSEIEKARNIFARSSINIILATVFVAIVIFCNLGNAISVINNGYQDVIPIFCILLLGKLFDLSTGMNDAVLTISNYYKFNFYVSLILVVVLYLLLRFLIPVYGVFGAAWSTTITLILFNIAKYIFVWKKLGMQPYSGKTVLVIVCGLPALAAGYFLPHFFSEVRHIYVHASLDTALRTVVIAIVYLAMLLWLKPSNDLEEYRAQIKKHKRLF